MLHFMYIHNCYNFNYNIYKVCLGQFESKPHNYMESVQL
jgi:hypothetical protein